METAKDYRERYEELTGSSLWQCPVFCRQGRMLVTQILPRRPPRQVSRYRANHSRASLSGPSERSGVGTRIISLGEATEHFLSAHQNAFEFIGGVPLKVLIDNPKTAVLNHPFGEKPLFHPRYLDFAATTASRHVLVTCEDQTKRGAWNPVSGM